MSDRGTPARPATARDLLYFRHPRLWQTWPFLPVVRRQADGELECGVLYDCWTVARHSGYSATVFLSLCGGLHKVSYADFAVMRS